MCGCLCIHVYLKHLNLCTNKIWTPLFHFFFKTRRMLSTYDMNNKHWIDAYLCLHLTILFLWIFYKWTAFTESESVDLEEGPGWHDGKTKLHTLIKGESVWFPNWWMHFLINSWNLPQLLIKLKILQEKRKAEEALNELKRQYDTEVGDLQVTIKKLKKVSWSHGESF